MASGANFLMCPKCSGDRVVYYIMLKGNSAVLKVICPNDHQRQAIKLPIETRDQWIGLVTDQIYRCAFCGMRIPEPTKIVRDGRWMVLIMECPSHGQREPKRYILDTLYPVIQSLHQNISTGGGLPPPFIPPPPPPPSPGDMFDRVRGAREPPPPPPPTTLGAPLPPPPPPPDAAIDPSKVCSDCGAPLAPGALFCTNCGKEIDEDFAP